MRKVLIIIASGLLFTSCLKKIEQVETTNTSIFDEEYAGSQWWQFDKLSTYTNSNNDQRLKFEYSIPEENAPLLQPTTIAVMASINNGTPFLDEAEITQSGDYKGVIEINPTGATNFCLELGVYIEEEDLTINSFLECKDL